MVENCTSDEIVLLLQNITSDFQRETGNAFIKNNNYKTNYLLLIIKL